jgi:hypothetical protein
MSLEFIEKFYLRGSQDFLHGIDFVMSFFLRATMRLSTYTGVLGLDMRGSISPFVEPGQLALSRDGKLFPKHDGRGSGFLFLKGFGLRGFALFRQVALRFERHNFREELRETGLI